MSPVEAREIMSLPVSVPHPGQRIKVEVIPPGMSVTKAAELVGVGRPALSNLLNGKAALSADMATRLEKAFNHPREDLMEMQARYDAAQAKQAETPPGTTAYVPPFLAIKANELAQWVSQNILARSRLAVLLRMLVHSTGRGLTKVDFPGNDDSERPGWDGAVEANEGTPWIAAGRSGWEFGTNEDPNTKANGDFEKSIKATDTKERTETTFVFVTPRRWTGKVAWVAAKKAKGLWRDVRAYDASDLEQWLEQSLPAQAWFANETHTAAQHVRSLDRCWADWANVTTPALAGSLFNSAIEATKRTLLSRLSKTPEGPILIAADSTEEALAFLAQLLGERGGDELLAYRDRVIVFDQPGVFPRLAGGAQTFIPVVYTREVERELAPFATTMHSIVVYPRNATIEPAAILEPAGYEAFNKALEEMGKDRDEVTRLASASGRSLTILRRQLSIVPAVQRPDWAADRKVAENLVPFLFVGAWNSNNEADRIGLSLLAGGRPYDDLEKECQSLALLNDAPIWSVGIYRGVISKLDLVYAIASSITSEDLGRYFSMAQMVLGEDDPALDLAEDKRWAASIYGKTREFSGAFREGFSETLVLLAVHGGSLFKGRLGLDTAIEAARVVRNLLPTPLTTRILEANDRDLPTYAEASPDEFLSIIENDLRSEHPAVLGLLRPVDPSAFGLHPSRTGLLWALEGLAWNLATLPRTVFVLARLAQVEINDNWVNKPANSLQAIFRAWMPQTAGDNQQRLDLMKALAKRFPEVAWKLCVAQFGNHHQIGDYSHKPRWRSDGYGFGEPFPTWGPVVEFMREMVEMALTWNDHTLEMLSDLLERIHDLTEADQARVWTLIECWAKNRADDNDKAMMREKVRISTLSRRAAIRAKRGKDTTGVAAAGKAAFAALEPNDVLNKHAWLFQDSWVAESADEIDDIENLDFQKREDRIRTLRTEALREVLSQRGVAGVLDLSRRGKAPWVIGSLMATVLLSEKELCQFLRLSMRPAPTGEIDLSSHRSLIAGALRALNDEKREALLFEVREGLAEVETALLLVLAPFGRNTWKLVDGLSRTAQARYWTEVTPDWIAQSDDENTEAVERLLTAGRPRAAFSSIRFAPSKVDPHLVCRLLAAMAQGGNEQPGHYMLEHYNVKKAFEHLNGGSGLTLDEKASLEFAYIEVLARPWDRRGNYGIPNLERYVEAHPEFFVQAIAWTYKRKDGASDPSEFQLPPERVQNMAERGYKLLEAIQRIPGHDDLGELKSDRLAAWVSVVRASCAAIGRADVADLCIGKVLACSPTGDNGIWPCEAVCNVMEDAQSDLIMRSAHTAVFNSRGVHGRGEGGSQERELADKYSKWGRALQVSHPFVASKLLMALARTYNNQAADEDMESTIRRRMR